MTDPRLFETLDRIVQAVLDLTNQGVAVSSAGGAIISFQILTIADTLISPTHSISGLFVAFFKQDATGGRLLSFDSAKFQHAETDILTGANTTSVYLFAANPSTNKWFQIMKVTGI